MNNTLITSMLLFFVFFLTTKTNAQEISNKHDYYLKISQMPIDSFPDKIVKFKNDLAFAEERNDTLSIAKNNLFLASTYYRLSSFDIAIDYNLKALQIFEKSADTVFTIYALNNMSAMYGTIKDFDALNEYSNKALKLSIAIKDTTFIIHSYLNIGSNYGSIDQEKSIFYLDKALELSKEINHNEAIINILLNKGVSYFYAKDYIKAKEYFWESLHNIKNKDKNVLTAILYSNIAELDFELGNYSKALEYGLISVKYFTENKNSVGVKTDVYKVLSKSCVELGKNQDVIAYMDKYIKLKDEEKENRLTEQISQLKVLYETNKLEAENKILKTENQLNESKLLVSKQRLFFVIIVLFFAFFIIGLIFFQNIKLKKLYRKIVQESVKSLKIEDDNIKFKKIIKENTNEIIDEEDSESEEKILFDEIVKIIEEEKLFAITDFNLDHLSKKLEVNRSYISRAINKTCNKSFVEFINDYRVMEAKKILCSKDVELLTIDAISKKAGFNSKSTFYRVFKSETGVTPTFFAKSIGVVL